MLGVCSHDGSVCGVAEGLVSQEVGVSLKAEERRLCRGLGVCTDGVGEKEKAEMCELSVGWAAESAGHHR